MTNRENSQQISVGVKIVHKARFYRFSFPCYQMLTICDSILAFVPAHVVTLTFNL